MSLNIYKPNKSNKGSLVSINFSAKTDKLKDNKLEKGDKSVYFSFVLQNGWDEKNQNGVFKDGKRCNVKFSPTEVGGILYALNNNSTLAHALGVDLIYHDGEKSATTIYFGPAYKKKKEGEKWIDTTEQRGFGIRAIKINKEKKEEKEQFAIGFNFAECVLLKNFLKNALTHINDALYAEDINRAKAYNESKTKKTNTLKNEYLPSEEESKEVGKENNKQKEGAEEDLF